MLLLSCSQVSKDLNSLEAEMNSQRLMLRGDEESINLLRETLCQVNSESINLLRDTLGQVN